MTEKLFTEEFFKELKGLPKHEPTVEELMVKIKELEIQIRNLRDALESSKEQKMRDRQRAEIYADIFDKFLDRITE